MNLVCLISKIKNVKFIKFIIKIRNVKRKKNLLAKQPEVYEATLWNMNNFVMFFFNGANLKIMKAC